MKPKLFKIAAALCLLIAAFLFFESRNMENIEDPESENLETQEPNPEDLTTKIHEDVSEGLDQTN